MARLVLQRTVMVLFFGWVLVANLRGQEMVTVPASMVAYPDLVIHNAKIYTMNDPSTTNGLPGTIVQAMAVRGDRIQSLGTNADILKTAGPRTQKLDMKGRLVVPGGTASGARLVAAD